MSPSQKPQPAVGSTRREFLVASSLAAGATAASLPVSRSAHAAGSDEIKIGLIGCGGRGAGAVASALQVEPAARLVAMADAFGDRMETAAKALQSRYPEQVTVDSARHFDGFDGCRKLLDSGVDVAILAEPPHFRPIHIDQCVAAGVHLFIEKPMAVDAPGVRRVLAAGEMARQKQLSFVSGFETRYSAGVREAVQRVHDGAARRTDQHANHLQRRAAVAPGPRDGLDGNAVSDAQLVLLHMVVGRSPRGATRALQRFHLLDHERRTTARRLGLRRSTGQDRSQVRRYLRSSRCGLRIRQWRAHLLLHAAAAGLLQRELASRVRLERPVAEHAGRLLALRPGGPAGVGIPCRTEPSRDHDVS